VTAIAESKTYETFYAGKACCD